MFKFIYLLCKELFKVFPHLPDLWVFFKQFALLYENVFNLMKEVPNLHAAHGSV